MDDISPRAIKVLQEANLLCCEDTRETGKLSSKFGINTKRISFHDGTSSDKIRRIVDSILSGDAVALVSDAGTPVVSDPGNMLVAEAHELGATVYTVPGPSAVTAALSIAGFNSKFIFETFLPQHKTKRRRALRELYSISEKRSVIFFESKHRILETLQEIEKLWGPDNMIALARELTKEYEETFRGTVSALIERCTEQPILGECTVVIAPRNFGKMKIHDWNDQL
eukprot:TRINITY_DN1824_c0_g1_i2.p1 TRINITY_DN1824_c0_g1~~TRINITY_DN1824_c0_g1_i2.p1  ORF type:complete len:226 (-),score=50.06 TRINITY_DN1824_c0_g1_i2:270-947(-)